mgnify:CR=1 FL=1
MKPIFRSLAVFLLAVLTVFLTPSVFAVPGKVEPPAKIEGTASTDPEPVVDPDKAVLSTITFPEEMVAGVFAREPDVLNATAISMDENNRLFIAETHRFDRGIEDNRRNWHWLREEVGLRSTAERLALYEKYADKKEPGYYTKYAEKIRVLEDKDGDGKAEKSWLYADGFNDPLDGTAAGIMAANGKVYFACIPHVWMLEDKDGDGVSDVRKSLQEGYGISVSLSGHDLNGFAFGPDGRIYFTIGDRGYDLKTADGRHLYDQYGGAIFRMEPDGSGLEVVHYSLRNPKEIAFDRYGEAFSVDNNADMGDKARVVHMVEGAVSGWNRGNQNFRNFPHAIDATSRHDTPWMTESWWDTAGENRPNAFLPPAGHVSVGPSGLAYSPGTGLNERWDNKFFVCDYRGGGSEVVAFEMSPKGAGYEVLSQEAFIKGFLNTDIEYGYDGKVYVSDFTGSWQTYDLGTVFVFHDPAETAKPVVAEVKKLFAEGFAGRSPEELAGLLRHQDLRVRQRAQFALAEAVENRAHFITATETGNELVTRLHGVWGLGQLARLKEDAPSVEALIKLTQDSHWRVRAQSAQALGEASPSNAREALISLLEDEHANPRMLAAIALGKAGEREDIPHLIKLLEDNTAEDAYLRHGAIEGLRLIAESAGTAEDLLEHKNHASKEVRLGLIIALRRLRDPGIAHFLKDQEESLVVETIQAINDNYIEGARPALAAATDLMGRFSVPIDYRIINAIFRVGQSEGPLTLLALAEDAELPEDTRIECIFQIQRWEEPPSGDPTTGKIRPLSGTRTLEAAKEEIREGLERLLNTTEGKMLAEVLRASEKFGLVPSEEMLRAHFLNERNLREVRMAALGNLKKAGGPRLVGTLQQTLSDQDNEIRRASLHALAEASLEVALKEAKTMLASEEVFARQVALEVLAKMKDPEAGESVLKALQTIETQPLGVQLDVTEAAAKRSEPEIVKALEAYRAQIPTDDPMAALEVTLEGGDVYKGSRIFYRHGAAQCVRCHKAEPHRRGGVAGPHLKDAGTKHDARYLLESLIKPNERISSGYGMVSVTLKNGEVVSGLLSEDSADVVVLANPEDGEKTDYPRDEIASFSSPVSTMPPMGHILTPVELRDLIAYLQSLQF